MGVGGGLPKPDKWPRLLLTGQGIITENLDNTAGVTGAPGALMGPRGGPWGPMGFMRAFKGALIRFYQALYRRRPACIFSAINLI